MPAAPIITFAVPFYSGIDYLPRALQSVLAQDDPRWQAFVCDNASPEPGVEALVHKFGDGRIRYVRNPANLGMAGNFNRCIDLAETDLISLVHADDELMPNYGRTVSEAAGRYPQAVAFHTRAQIIGPDSKPAFSMADFVKDFINPSPRQELVLSGEPGLRALLKGNFIMAPTLCFRKSVLGTRRFREGFKFVLDLELTTTLMLDGESLVGLPARCYRYRRHEDNATAEFTRTQLRFREESDYYDRMETAAQSRGWSSCVRLARQKRIIKLNVTFCALQSAARLDLAQARRGLKLLFEL